MYTKICSNLSKLSLIIAVILLQLVILCVIWQVFGRYVLNNTPTWAETLAMLLVLFVTAFGVAVGVRESSHIGLESFLILLPERIRIKIELLVYFLVGVFGAFMVYGGWRWASVKWNIKKPMLPITDGIDYIPLIISGILIILFSIEHIIAKLKGQIVKSSWN